MSDAGSPTVVLGVTGCIAAYKACELARELVRRGLRVKVVMTDAATRFVGPATFRALTGEPVVTSLWDDPGESRVHHVSLGQEAGVVAIVPCTANVLAKLAHGRADDTLTTTVLASEAPLVLAPAMNARMWRKRITQENLSAMRERGAIVIEPERGELACGEEGEGRLAGVRLIADVIGSEIRRTRDLEGMRVVVTAGGTQEPIDPVRFIGNRSSGKTGYAIAEEAARRGATVTLVSAPTALPEPFGVDVIQVVSAEEMRVATLSAAKDVDCVVMSAAVADLRPVSAAAEKLKKAAAPKDRPLRLELELTADILAELGSAKGRRVLVGFAAETGDALPAAREKLARKGVDLVVANDVSEQGLGFGSDENRVVIVGADTEEALPVMSKREIARAVLDRVAGLLGRL